MKRSGWPTGECFSIVQLVAHQILTSAHAHSKPMPKTGVVQVKGQHRLIKDSLVWPKAICVHLMQAGTSALSALTRLETLRLYELENLDEIAFCAAASTLTR